jgi:ribonuclease-3
MTATGSTDLVVILRTHSDIEASIVKGLLAAHGIETLVSSDLSHAVFPLAIDGLGETRVSVRADVADEARRIIESHRDHAGSGRLVPIADEFVALEARLGYRFRDRGLVEHALTHRSRAHEDASGAVVDNESLEFLGDAVLGLVVADLLYHAFPDWSEGRKSKLKAALVSAPVLARLAAAIGLGEHLLLGRGEEKSGGRHKQALLADALEALIAAIYLDGGLERAHEFIAREMRGLITDAGQTGGVADALDHKSVLQEWLQSRGLPPPVYKLAREEGPDHRKVFEVEVWAEGRAVGRASGGTKKEAEQLAASLALDALKGQPPGS